jgi:hypothetical protein
MLQGLFVRNGKLMSTLFSAAGQHSSAIVRGHAVSETMLIFSFSLRGLVCPFHLSY